VTTPDGYAKPARRVGVGAAVVVVILALAVTVGIAIVRGATTPAEAVPTPAASVSIEGGELYVHVSGAVAVPGLYRLHADARVVDAVAAAGGFADDAEESGVNLARPVTDGEQIVVPVAGEAPTTGPGPVGAAGGGRVDLNAASVTELDTLPRIGPAMAQRIVDWREANGRFTSVEDLLAVPGIGDKMLETLRPLVTV
jgi:competence protein ComEA